MIFAETPGEKQETGRHGQRKKGNKSCRNKKDSAGCILIWPERPGSWRNGAREAKKAFADVIRAIAKSEEVYLAASGKTFSEAEKLAQRLQTDEALYPIRVFTAEGV